MAQPVMSSRDWKCDQVQEITMATDSDRIAQSLMEIYTLLPPQYSNIEQIQEDPVLILENTVDYLEQLLRPELYGPPCPSSTEGGYYGSLPTPNTANTPLPTSSQSAHHVDAEMEDMRSGYRDCQEEVVRFLMESENLPENDPIIVGLREHLQSQENTVMNQSNVPISYANDLPSQSTPTNNHCEFENNLHCTACSDVHTSRVECRSTVCFPSNTPTNEIYCYNSQYYCTCSTNNFTNSNQCCHPVSQSMYDKNNTHEVMTSNNSVHLSDVYRVTSELLKLLESDDVYMLDDDIENQMNSSEQ